MAQPHTRGLRGRRWVWGERPGSQWSTAPCLAVGLNACLVPALSLMPTGAQALAGQLTQLSAAKVLTKRNSSTVREHLTLAMCHVTWVSLPFMAITGQKGNTCEIMWRRGKKPSMMEGEKEEESMTAMHSTWHKDPVQLFQFFSAPPLPPCLPPSHCFSVTLVPLFIELYYRAPDVKNVV